LPGRLSITRSFGDIEAKYEQFGGKPNVVTAQPEIIQFKIQDNHDFIILASTAYINYP
jgi:protein phosphatase 2C family protein 2/3